MRRAVVGTLIGGLLAVVFSASSSHVAPASCPTPQGRYSEEMILAVRPEVEAMITENFHSVATFANAVHVDLLPGRERLAGMLLRRFGEVVEITVGGVAYCGRAGISPRCPDLPGSDALPPGLHLTLRLDRASIRSTDALAGELTVRNDAPTLFEMDPGQPLVASIVKSGTRTVVAHFTGSIVGTGLGLRLRQGEERTIRVIVGTSRCDGRRGSALSAGSYGVRAGIGPEEGLATLLAPEVFLMIEPG